MVIIQAANVGSIPTIHTSSINTNMRVSQLFESDVHSALSKIWQGSTFNDMVSNLKMLGDEEAMLAQIVKNAQQKHATQTPEIIFNYLKPLLDVVDDFDAEEMKGGTIYHNMFALHLMAIVNMIFRNVQKDQVLLKKLLSKLNVDQLEHALTDQNKPLLKLVLQKLNRTKKQEREDKENQQYVFIGRPGFKEISDGNFKKTLEIENLVPVDRFDISTHQMIVAMKMRARFQGENSEVYTVTLPKGSFDGGKVPDWLADLIDEHKTRVTH